MFSSFYTSSLFVWLVYKLQPSEYPLIVYLASLVLELGMHLTFYFFAIVDGWWKRIKSHSLHAGSPKTLGLVHSLACKTCWNMAGNIPFWQSFSSFSYAFFQVKKMTSMLAIKLCSPSLQDIRQKLEESLPGTGGGRNPHDQLVVKILFILPFCLLLFGYYQSCFQVILCSW